MGPGPIGSDPNVPASAPRHIGPSAAQAGSLNAPGRMRFDCTSPGGGVSPAALAEIAAWLAPEGRVVVSLPNVAHWTVRAGLLAGRWEYRDSGILDDTHLRFFTWASGARLVEDAGLLTVERQPIISGLGAHAGRTLPRAVERAWRAVGRRRPGLFAFQQLLVARRP